MLGAPSVLHSDLPEESCQLYSCGDPAQAFDLYDLLLHEPTAAKKPSVLYDYSPPQQPLPDHLEPACGLELVGRSHSAETEVSVRRCTCSKTRCQKNYCECFKQGVACSSACECVGCGNREKLFSGRVAGDRGCNCQKSRCLKNYCECHLHGRRCTPACRCTECANADLPEDCLDLAKAAHPRKRRKAAHKH